MAWYDLFANVYDSLLEGVYLEHRAEAASALELQPGMVVVDVGCGTGASFAELVAGVGPSGRVIGVDASSGMLRRARDRIERMGWTNVDLVEAKVDDAAAKRELAGLVSGVDRVLFFLSLSVIDDWQAVLSEYFSALAAGGRLVIVDVHNPKPGPYARYVELVSRGTLTRESWASLDALSSDFVLDWRPSSWTLGGQLYVARGLRSRETRPVQPRL